MAVPIITEVTTAELAALVSGSLLNQGLQYKDTETGVLYLATSSNSRERVFLYKSYIATISARNIQPSSTPPEGRVLVIGKTYVVDVKSGSDDFSNVGYVSDKVPFVATGTTPTSWAFSTVYCVNDNPIAVSILENTLGDIVWTGSAGWYDGTLEGAFNTVVIPPFGDLSFMPIMNSSYIPIAYYQVVTNGLDAVGLWIVDTEGHGIDIWEVCPANLKIYVEIRVYN